MFYVDPTDPTPIDVQLAHGIRSAVEAGLLEPGERLPTVRQLAVDLRVNANAVASAYRELTSQGVLEERPGMGTLVRSPREALHREEAFRKLCALEDAFLVDAAALGFSLDDVIIHLDSRRNR